VIDRREFLGTIPLVLLGTGCGRRLSPPPLRLGAWGVQLYTVRQEMQADADRTLATLAEIGYREVELAGMYGMTARDFRGKLDAAGLRAVSSHHGLAEVRNEWDRTLDDALELGQSFVVVPSIPKEEADREGLLRVAADFDRAGSAARGRRLRFGYHNHDWEFAPLPDGTDPMKLLLDRTDPQVVDWQMDVFWVVHGGASPLEWLNDHHGRVSSVHVKDRAPDGEMVDVGDGGIDYATILSQAEAQGLRHAFIEHDFPADPIESVRRSFRHASSLGANS